MTFVQSADETNAKNIALMGEELGSAFVVLNRKLIELHIVWQQYQQLFGSDPETVKLLNRTSGLFFKIVQDELWDSVLLGISRMTDPPKSSGRKNLTIQSILGLITDPKLKAQVQDLCAVALDNAEFAREHRNKRIAHQDHSYVSDRVSNPLAGISRTKVDNMLASLCAVLNMLNMHYRDTTTFYTDFIDESGARVLVAKLKKLERLQVSSEEL